MSRGVNKVGVSKSAARRVIALMSAISLSALATGALAQSTPPATTSSQPAQLQEVIVTANRSRAKWVKKSPFRSRWSVRFSWIGQAWAT